MKSYINFRFLLGSIVAFGVVCLVTFAVHAFQVKRQSAFMLERARRFNSENRTRRTQRCEITRSIFSWLPGMLKRTGSSVCCWPIAVRPGLLYANWKLRFAVCRTHDALRRRVIDLDIARGRYSDAREHLLFLLARFSSDGKLREQLGICQEASGDYTGAVESFQQAIAVDPARCESYVHLADVLRRLARDQEADVWMNRLVGNNPDSATAHFLRARYLYLSTKKQEKAALGEAENGDQAGPEGNRRLVAGREPGGIDGDTQGPRLFGTDDRRRSGAWPTATSPCFASSLPPIIAIVPGLLSSGGSKKATERRQLLWYLGGFMIEQGQLDEAKKAVDLDEAKKAVDQLRGLPVDRGFDPVLIDYLQARIETAKSTGMPRRWPTRTWSGNCSSRVGADSGGKLAQGTAPEILKDVEYRLALCYEQLGDSDAQLAAFREAARIDPLYVPARMGVASTLSSLGRVSEAMEEYRQIGRLEGMAAKADFQVARLLVLRNLRLNGADRDWKEVEAILNRLTQPSTRCD